MIESTRSLLTNAGTPAMGPLASYGIEDFDRLIRINLRSSILCVQAAANHMIRSRRWLADRRDEQHGRSGRDTECGGIWRCQGGDLRSDAYLQQARPSTWCDSLTAQTPRPRAIGGRSKSLLSAGARSHRRRCERGGYQARSCSRVVTRSASSVASRAPRSSAEDARRSAEGWYVAIHQGAQGVLVGRPRSRWTRKPRPENV